MVAILAIGLVASGLVAAQRFRVESANRAVEIVLDYDEIAQIAAATGREPLTALKELKRAGATSVAVTEQTIRDLMDDGLVTAQEGGQISVAGAVGPRVISRLRTVLGDQAVTPIPLGSPRCVVAMRNAPLSYVQTLPAGLPENAIAEVLGAGLEVTARVVNYPGATPQAIETTLAGVRSLGIRKVVFSGDQVLGYRGATRETARSIVRHGLYFGRVEFAKQKGEVDLAEHISGRVIVVHSISQNEMPALNANSAAERFGKAVKERGVRMCYVRMLDTASSDVLASSAGYVSRIAKEITSAGYALRSSHPLGEVGAPEWTRVLVGLGVAAGLVLLILTVVDLSASAVVIWTVAAALICAAIPLTGDIGRKAVALLSALVFPTLAAMVAVRNGPDGSTPVTSPFLRALGRLVTAVAISAAGGLLIVGLLSSRDFMLRIDQFAGIKLAHVAPLLILAVLFAGNVAWKSDTWAAQKQRVVESIRKLAMNPVMIWQAAGLAVLMVIVGLMVARSGNDAGLQVSGAELKFRAILDRVMLVRPRTKEFLIGYPALILGIAYALRGRRQWAAPLVALGSIGLASALNTFCHIHTPLALSALRTLNGLIAGSLVGLIAYWALRGLPGREGK